MWSTDISAMLSDNAIKDMSAAILEGTGPAVCGALTVSEIQALIQAGYR